MLNKLYGGGVAGEALSRLRIINIEGATKATPGGATSVSSFLPQTKAKLYNIVFNSIKYKNMGGIRMEVSGRLTPRYRADRSVYKLL